MYTLAFIIDYIIRLYTDISVNKNNKDFTISL